MKYISYGKSREGEIEDEHKRFVIWLDAYITDELEPLEKEQLEHHIGYCTECKNWLIDIPRFKNLLKSQEIHLKQGNIPYSIQQHSPSFVQSVLTGIANNRTGADQRILSEKPVKMQKTVPTLPGKKYRPKKHYLRSISFIAAILCLVAIIMISMPQFIQQNNKSQAKFPPISWKPDETQTVIRNGSDIFALKHIEGTALGFRFFYAFSSLQSTETPHIEVISLLPSQSNSAIPLKINIQPLGRLGTFRLGVIEVPYKNRVGQTIVIQEVSVEKNTMGKLTPLKQLLPEPSITGSNFFIDQNNLPEIIWSGPLGEKTGVGFFYSTNSKQSESEASYLYLRLDLDHPIQVITQKEFLLSAGNQNAPSCTKCSKPLSIKDLLSTATAVAKATVGASNKK